MALTEIEKKIREINGLNKFMTFKYLPTVYENLKNIHTTHGQLMDKYTELVELHRAEENKNPA